VVYQVAAQWMRAKNGSSQYLRDTEAIFTALFWDLVDRVMVIYDAKLMDDWLYAGFKVDIGQEHSIAKPIANVFMLMTHTNRVIMVKLHC